MMQSWVGRPVTQIIDSWGPPAAVSDESPYKLYVWRSLPIDHHHYSGQARVTYNGKTFGGAFLMEDFGPNHYPELGLTNLYRMTITPEARMTFDTSDQPCEVRVNTTAAGHYVWSACEWRIDATPGDASLRTENAGYLGQTLAVRQQVIVRQRGHSVTLTCRQEGTPAPGGKVQHDPAVETVDENPILILKRDRMFWVTAEGTVAKWRLGKPQQ